MEKNGLTWILVILVALSLITSGLGFFAVGNIKVDVPNIPAPVITDKDKADIANLVISNLPETPVVEPTITETVTEVTDNSKLDALYKDSDLDEEVKSEELVMAELNSNDFKRQLKNVLNDAIDNDNLTFKGHDQYGLQIESWRDIEDVYSVSIEDIEFESDNESAFVEVEFKVKYILDDDEDEIGRARLTIVYTVENLNDNEDFEDAEIGEEFETLSVKLYG